MTSMPRAEHLFKKAARRDAIYIPNLIFTGLPLEILRHLNEAGFDNPILHGGALRDIFLAQTLYLQKPLISDYDVRIHIPNPKHQLDPLKILKTLISKEGIHAARNDPGILNYEEQQAIRYYLSVKDKKIDLLIITGQEPSAQLIANLGDTSVDSIAMDHKGNVYAHPNFESDAENGRYQYLGNDMDGEHYHSTHKLERLNDKYDGHFEWIPA